MRVSTILVTCSLAIVLSGCNILQNASKTITFRNLGTSNLVLETVSKGGPISTPTTIRAQTEANFTDLDSIYIEFIVSYNGKKYDGDSGYVEDYAAYSLVFSESGGELQCERTHRSDGSYVRPLTVVP